MKNQALYTRFGFALNGIAAAWRTEHSLRWHSVAAALVLLLLIGLRPAPIWWAIMAITVAAVMATELFNTAMEILADHLHPQQHPQIKLVKDCAAGAVLLTALGALAVAMAFIYAQFN